MPDFNQPLDFNRLVRSVTPDPMLPVNMESFASTLGQAPQQPQQQALASPPPSAPPPGGAPGGAPGGTPSIQINVGSPAPAGPPAPPVFHPAAAPIQRPIIPVTPSSFDQPFSRAMQPMRLPPAVPQNGQAIARQKPGKLELLGQILKAVGEIGTGITMGAPAYAKFAQDRREATARQAMADASLQHNMQQDLEAQRRWDWANDPQRQAAERAIQRQENLSYAEAQARFKDQWEEMQRNKLADQMEADPSLRAYASSVRFGLPIRQDLNKSEIEIWQEAWLANPRNAGRPKTDMIEDYRKVYNANRSQTTGKKAEVIVNADGSRNLVFYDVNQPNQYSTTPIPGKAHVPGEGDTYQIIKDENTGQVWRVPVKAGAPQEVQKPEGGPLLSEKEKEFSSAQVGRIDSQAFMDAVREWNETPGNQAYDPKNQYAAQMDPAAFKWISTRAAENWDATAQRLFPTTSRSMNKNKPKSLMDIMADRFEAATQNFMKSQPEPRKKK